MLGIEKCTGEKKGYHSVVRFKREKAVVPWFSKIPHLQIDYWTIESWRIGHKIVALNATSVGMGRRNRFLLCMCSRNSIIVLLLLLLLLLLILLCTLLLWWIPCICSPPTPHVYIASIRSAFGIRSEVCGRFFLRKHSTCEGCWPFSQRSSMVDVWRNS